MARVRHQKPSPKTKPLFMDQEVAARALTRMRPIRMKQIVD